jgi:hypothetical protein
MITRVIQRKRPYPFTLLMFVGAIVVAAGLFAAVAMATVSDSGTCSVEVPDSSESKTCDPPLTNAIVDYIGSDADNSSSGTGLFDPFVRLQGSPTEKGYNTNGAVAFDTKTGKWTHAILVNAIPIIDCDGNDPGTALCWELFVDINEGNNAKHVSLNEVEVWFTNNPTLVGYVDPSGFPAASGATLQYDFSGSILINDVNQGSGRGDLRYLIPIAGIGSWSDSTYFVLYSKWGTSGTIGSVNYNSEGGFEEWKVRKVPPRAVPTVTTSATASVTLGGSISDTATISGLVNPINGTITFSLYGPNDATCSGTNLVAGNAAFTVGPVTANGNYVSPNFTPLAVGTYRWIANYSGDANNTATSNGCNGANEASAVGQITPTLSTAPFFFPQDKVTFSGATVAGGDIEGTVEFKLYSDLTCTTLLGTFGSIGVDTGTSASASTNQSSVKIASDGANGAGTYGWTVSFTSTNPNYASVSASACSSEPLVVSFTAP